jgi:hypothetical protein
MRLSIKRAGGTSSTPRNSTGTIRLTENQQLTKNTKGFRSLKISRALLFVHAEYMGSPKPPCTNPTLAPDRSAVRANLPIIRLCRHAIFLPTEVSFLGVAACVFPNSANYANEDNVIGINAGKSLDRHRRSFSYALRSSLTHKC